MFKSYLPAVALVCATSAAHAGDAIYAFHWQGASGYSVRGAMAIDDALMGHTIYETDVSCFVIDGMKDGVHLGRWQLGALGPDTTWRLHFDTVTEAFVVEGAGIRMPQAWNMNGSGDDCGAKGFGFNLGNVGQDICVNNTIVHESRVPPPTPFPATRIDSFDFPDGACRPPMLLGLVPLEADDQGAS